MRKRVILITGGAGMLGREYAVFLLRAGANVVIFDIVGKEVLDRVRREIKRASGRAPMALFVDITDPQQVSRAIKAVQRRFGRIDVLVNNADMNPVPGSQESRRQFSPYERYPLDLWKREIEVGLTGTFIVTQAVLPLMKRQKRGVIINIGSIYGETAPDHRIYRKGMFKSIAYATGKGALPNFTRSLASYAAPFGIRVNLMTLGGVYAGQYREFVKNYRAKTMLGRMAERDDFNGTLLYLASDASRYMTGANVVIDGGWSAW